MYKNPIDFDEVKENSFGILPEGSYLAQINNVGPFMWVSGEGAVKVPIEEVGEPSHYIQSTFKIVSDSYKGKVEFGKYYLWTQNKKTVNFFRAQYKSLCIVLEIDPNTTEYELFDNRLVNIIIGHSKEARKPNGEPYVNITKVQDQALFEGALSHFNEAATDTIETEQATSQEQKDKPAKSATELYDKANSLTESISEMDDDIPF